MKANLSKKLLLLMATFALCLGMVACGSESSDEASSDSSSESSEASTDAPIADGEYSTVAPVANGEIKDGTFTVTSALTRYGDVLYEEAEFEIKVASDCKYYSGGGNVETEEMDVDYINEILSENEDNSLPVDFVVEGGEITAFYVVS